jgi:hypothetical protein
MVVTNIYLIIIIGYYHTQLLTVLPYEWQQHSTVEVLFRTGYIYYTSTNLEVREKVLEEHRKMFTRKLN